MEYGEVQKSTRSTWSTTEKYNEIGACHSDL
jgi:hypothetical protein